MTRKYRKKPVLIDAITVREVCSLGYNEWPEWVQQGYNNHTLAINRLGIAINTLEGVMNATFDDMLIKGIQGELYPCKKDIFHQSYELAE